MDLAFGEVAECVGRPVEGLISMNDGEFLREPGHSTGAPTSGGRDDSKPREKRGSSEFGGAGIELCNYAGNVRGRGSVYPKERL